MSNSVQSSKIRPKAKISLDVSQRPIIDVSAIKNLSTKHQRLFCDYAVGPVQQLAHNLITDAFESQVKANPDAIAAEEFTGKSITYRQLNYRANRLAAALIVRGVKPGDNVGLFLHRSIDMVVGILATLKAGAAYIPQSATISSLETLKHIIEVTQTKVILTTSSSRQYMPNERTECIEIDQFGKQCDTRSNRSANTNIDSQQKVTNPNIRISSDSCCFILFTSGTTGKPNGVRVTHRNICNILLTEPGNLGIKPGTKVSQLLNIAFDMAAWETLGCLMQGGTLLIRGSDFQQTASRANVIIATPSILTTIDVEKCKQVKTVAVAGEPCAVALADKWAGVCTFYNSCGPTETTIVNTMKRHRVSDRPLTIGKPTPNNTVYILDQNRQPCGIGQVGEMWAGGDCVTAGYLENKILTDERYAPDPYLGGERKMFNTRDLGKWTSDGELIHLGRTDDQVKVRGFRVELDSVSAVLEAIPDCDRAVTLKLNDRELVSFVSPLSVDSKCAAAVVAKELPYYCVPSAIYALEKLPFTSRGKIDKYALLEKCKTIGAEPVKKPKRNARDDQKLSNIRSHSTYAPAIKISDVERPQSPAVDQNSHVNEHSDSKDRLPIESYTSIKVPAEKTLWRSIWAHHRLYHYWRLVVLVFIVNALLFSGLSAGNQYWFSGPNVLQNSLNMVVANFALGILIRQQLVINALFAIATSVPVSWPLAIRRIMGKVYHFGGLHIGGTVAGTLWFIYYFSLAVSQYNQNVPTIQLATLLVAYSIIAVLLLMLLFAVPTLRQKFHNRFEMSHRFGGWSVLVLIWVHLFLFINDTRALDTPLIEALLNSFAFWTLCVITLSIIAPWGQLQRVPIEIVRPSDHVALVNFDHGVTPFAGSSTAVSRNPLMEWHSFANVPAPGKSGFRLTISRAGDWTGRLIDDQPSHVWVKGIPTAGVGNVDQLFKRVVWIATGSGIGPTLPHLLSREVPAHLIWSTRDARQTYGDDLVDEILDVEPNALIWDTNTRGRPDLVQLAHAGVKTFDAEAVIVIANEKLTRQVVYGMESRGIPAYGAIWDS